MSITLFFSSAKKEKKMDIIITVPHSEAPKDDKYGHFWDFTALTFAELLEKAWKNSSSKIKSVRLITADYPRTILDCNRPWSREYTWRRILTEKVTADKNSNIFHMDIHSYPADYPGFLGFDIAILSRRRPIARDGKLAAALINELNVSCGLIVAPGMVDIRAEVEDQLQDKSRSIMIEISEKSTANYDRIAQFLVSAITIKDGFPCRTLDPKVPCFYVDHKLPQNRVPLWIPSDNVKRPRSFHCAHCKTQVDMVNICEACACVCYCSFKCQQRDWDERQHHLLCSILAMPDKPQYVGARCCCDTTTTKQRQICSLCNRPNRRCSLCGEHFCSENSMEWNLHAQKCYEQNIGRL